MTRITNPASPGNAAPIASQGWMGPPIPGSRPIDLGGRFPEPLRRPDVTQMDSALVNPTQAWPVHERDR
jgi:hypothetical protein